MTDNWKTLRVPPEAYDDAKAQKERHGRTWGEQLVRPDDEEDTDEDTDLAADVAQQIDYAYIADAVAEEVLGRLEGRR